MKKAIRTEKTTQASGLLIALLATSLLISACGDSVFFGGNDATTTAATSGGSTPAPSPSPTPTPTPTTPTPSPGTLGKALWANNCATCHGGNTGKGANVENILAAIAINTGGMGFLSSSIGSTEASQIATYAANPGAY